MNPDVKNEIKINLFEGILVTETRYIMQKKKESEK